MARRRPPSAPKTSLADARARRHHAAAARRDRLAQVLRHGHPGLGPFAQNLTLWVGTARRGDRRARRQAADARHRRVPAEGPHRRRRAHHRRRGRRDDRDDARARRRSRSCRATRAAGDVIALGVPVWIADLALPIGFGLIALRLVWRASPHWTGPRRRRARHRRRASLIHEYRACSRATSLAAVARR